MAHEQFPGYPSLADALEDAEKLTVRWGHNNVRHLSAAQVAAIVEALRSVPSETVTQKKWLAFDIGCIECGEDSKVIGTYTTKDEAEAACKAASDEQQKHWTGQHSMEVFEL